MARHHNHWRDPCSATFRFAISLNELRYPIQSFLFFFTRSQISLPFALPLSLCIDFASMPDSSNIRRSLNSSLDLSSRLQESWIWES
ncbi:hypothetical protein LINGRAHAP2_LOCUS3645 [Linum grandiflorum]